MSGADFGGATDGPWRETFERLLAQVKAPAPPDRDADLRDYLELVDEYRAAPPRARPAIDRAPDREVAT